MQVAVGPSKADLQDKVQVGQGAVGPDEKAPPEHRVNVPDPGMEEVSFGLGSVFHGGVSLPPCQRLGSFSPQFEMLSRSPSPARMPSSWDAAPPTFPLGSAGAG